jgi:hypothetical protein
MLATEVAFTRAHYLVDPIEGAELHLLMVLARMQRVES